MRPSTSTRRRVRAGAFVLCTAPGGGDDQPGLSDRPSVRHWRRLTAFFLKRLKLEQGADEGGSSRSCGAPPPCLARPCIALALRARAGWSSGTAAAPGRRDDPPRHRQGHRERCAAPVNVMARLHVISKGNAASLGIAGQKASRSSRPFETHSLFATRCRRDVPF